MSSTVLILGTIVLYLCGMLAVGAFFSKSSANSSNDFYLGGRKLGPFVTAMSAEASDMSSWLLMGLPGVAYYFGIADAAWTAIGLGIGTYINWLVVAKRIRRYSVVAGDSYTLPEFFSKRYHDNKNVLACFAAIVIIVFFIPYTASGFAAVGKLFNSLFGWDYMTAATFGAVVVVSYTILGGFMAVSTTDLIQSIFMSIALIIVLVFGINTAGGWSAVCENANSLAGYISLTSMTNIMTKEVSAYGIITIISTMAWGLGYFGMPHLLLRFMAIEDEEKISLSRRVASIWVVIAMAVAIVIGVVGYGMSANGSIELLETSPAAESVIVKIAGLLSTHGVAATICAGIILAGILASTMSTADSQLLAAASSVSENLVKEFFGIKLTQKQTLLVSRGTVLVISAIALFLARDPNSSVFTIVSFAWAGFGAAFGPVVLLALFWKRSNKNGALAGMIAGGAMVFIWKFLVRPLGGAWNIYELLPAFIIACAANVIVSLMTKAPDQSILDEFEAARIK